MNGFGGARSRRLPGWPGSGGSGIDAPPRRLEPGDAVGVVAPGYAVEARKLAAGLDRLRGWGLRPVVGQHVLARDGYFAGTDAERATDLVAMARNREVRAIWFARGGYGTARLLEQVPWRALGGKLLLGYSDMTALFNGGIRRVGMRSLYGPCVSELADAGDFHETSLRTLLAGKPLTVPIAARNVLVPGTAHGILAGGTLSVLTHLCGTRWMPRLRDAVLFIEEVGERTYRIDRMLTQLRQSGALDGLAGVLIGALSIPPRQRFPPDRRITEVLREFFEPLGIPVVRGLPVGHLRNMRTIPLGERVRIDTPGGRVIFPRLP